MVIDFDAKNDVLYIVLTPSHLSYGEDRDGVVIMRDVDTDEITGLTIFDFKRKYNNNSLSDELLPKRFSFGKDVYPKLSKFGL